MIDLHSHILPGIDDGPRDLAGSVAFARAAVAAGTTTIAATPHIDSHYGLHARDRDAPLSELRAALLAEDIPLTVEPGAEIAIDRYIDLDEAELAELTLGSGPYLMLEAPLSVAAGAFDGFLATLLSRGVRVLIAHPERCPSFQRHPDRLGDLVRMGALGQVTAASLAGRFGRTVRDTAVGMLRDGLVHVLASDAHDADRRGPDLEEGLTHAARALPGASALDDWLTVDAPAAVLEGARLPRRPPLPVPPPRRRWRRG
jgi:protein-tyrosine phosphatase